MVFGWGFKPPLQRPTLRSERRVRLRTMLSREEEDEVKVWGIGNTLILIL